MKSVQDQAQITPEEILAEDLPAESETEELIPEWLQTLEDEVEEESQVETITPPASEWVPEFSGVEPQEVPEQVIPEGADDLVDLSPSELLRSARTALEAYNIERALGSYNRLIQSGEFLEETIHDLRDALYRYPIDIAIWQSLGDAYMRSNRLQEALDAYTKAEELLR